MSEQSATAARLVDRLRRSLGDLVPPGSGLLLAVSGGSDSMGLLHMAAGLRQELGLRMMVGCVDHGLRAGAAAEIALVEAEAGQLGLDVVVAVAPEAERGELGSGGPSIQAWARDVRYRLLEQVALAHDLGYIATAHTRDDQAETVLLRILRGTGLDGLAGMPRRRVLPGGAVLVRPLLELDRAEIRASLEAARAPWCEDPSNRDPRFLRPRIRHEVLPLLEAIQPGVAGHLAALASDAKEAASFIDERLLDENKLIVDLRLAGGVKVDSRVFREVVPRGLWGRVVRLAVRRAQGDTRRLERGHVVPIETLLETRKTTGMIPLPGACLVHVDRGSLYVFPGPLPPRPTGAGEPRAVGAGRWKLRFSALGALAEVRADRAELVAGLELRARLPGDRVLGSERRFKEILSRAEVPRPYRDFIPVLALDREIVSAPVLLSSRMAGLDVNWLLENNAPILDIAFAG